MKATVEVLREKTFRSSRDGGHRQPGFGRLFLHGQHTLRRQETPTTTGQPPPLKGRTIFYRDSSVLDNLRRLRPKGRCAWCKKRLPKGRLMWCRDDCYQKAYESSIVFDWNATRKLVLERDHYRCRLCGKGPLAEYRDGGRPKEEWAEVDHVIPVKLAPERQYELSNLRTLCHACHANRRRGKPAAAGPDTAVAASEGLNPTLGPNSEQVQDTAVIPLKLKEAIRADLLQNLTIEQVSIKHNINQNAVKGVWSSLKAAGIIPAKTKPGQIVFQNNGQPMKEGPQPPTGTQPGPAPVQTLQPAPVSQPPQAQPQTATMPATVQTPVYEIAPTVPNGGPRAPAPNQATLSLGGFPMTVDATGFVTKVYMNPKNLLWYDYFRKKHPEFDGDFADFLSDTVEYFFKSQGLEVVIRKYERVES